jgi:hypothetical protein
LRDDLLHQRRAGFCPCRNDDIVIAEDKIVPALGIDDVSTDFSGLFGQSISARMGVIAVPPSGDDAFQP